MTVDITFSNSEKKKSGAIIICFYSGKKALSRIKDINIDLGGFVNLALEKTAGFDGGAGQSEISLLPAKAPYDYLVLLGLGDEKDLDIVEAEKIGGKLYSALEGKKITTAELLIGDSGKDKDKDNNKDKTISYADLAAHIAIGARLRSYSFERYKTKRQEDEDQEQAQAQTSKKPERINLVLSDEKAAEKIFSYQDCGVRGVFLARDFVNEPPNILYPYSYANRILEELKPLGIEIEILDKKKLEHHGMGALLAVGQGSNNPPCLVIMRWNGLDSHQNAKEKTPPLALVGKGVTFDTGGISLKPGAGMDEMKMDMGGSAAVVGAMKSLALRKAKVNVVGVVGLVENMPSDKAYRPADIIKSYSGKTIEVLNTDAEGRLVLVDALSYVQKNYKPRMIIDLATLTGAMIVALGHEYCGTFANDDSLWAMMDKAGEKTGDKVWRMPLDKAFKKEVESDIADVQNIAKCGRDAGSCTAAAFLWHFIEKGTPWAHMDIAGTAWIKKDRDTGPKFGTGFGVRLLDRLIADNYE